MYPYNQHDCYDEYDGDADVIGINHCQGGGGLANNDDLLDTDRPRDHSYPRPPSPIISSSQKQQWPLALPAQPLPYHQHHHHPAHPRHNRLSSSDGSDNASDDRAAMSPHPHPPPLTLAFDSHALSFAHSTIATTEKHHKGPVLPPLTLPPPAPIVSREPFMYSATAEGGFMMPMPVSMSDANGSGRQGDTLKPEGHHYVEAPVVNGPRSGSVVVVTDHESGEEDTEEDRENAFIILLRMSLLAPVFSFAAAFYTICILVFLTFISPLRLCPAAIYKPSVSFSAHLSNLLLPLLHKHRRLISTVSPSQSRRERHPYRSRHSTSRPSPLSPASPPADVAASSVAGVVSIHLLSPILILPICLACWVAAFFWVFAMVLGNPDGTERRDDGRAAVLGVRNWWRIWLGDVERKRRSSSSSEPSLRVRRKRPKRGGGVPPEMTRRGSRDTSHTTQHPHPSPHTHPPHTLR